MMFMYKINLQNLNENNWIGSKICLKKNFPQPQKLRNMKFKNYPFWRIDKFLICKLLAVDGIFHFCKAQ